jgi:hypothetical protein
MIPAELASSPAPTRSLDRDEPLVFSCPECANQFGITEDLYGKQVGCPHCHATVVIHDSESTPPQIEVSRTRVKIDVAGASDSAAEKIRVAALSGVSQIVVDSAPKQPPEDQDVTDGAGSESAELAEKFVPQNIDHLLPPRFDVIDPEQLALRSRRSADRQVILPDGQGGLKKVDDRIVRVKHGAEEIKLVALSPAELRRRRQIQTAIFMIGGAFILAIIFALLRKSV